MQARQLAVGRPCLALRVTYVGELGWELYCATEFGGALWDAIWEAGREHGLVAGGYKAIDSLRLEKGYRVWGADITPEDTPYEAGLGFAVKPDKGDFVGRDALVAAPEPERRLRCLTLADPRAIALGSEPVRVGDDSRARDERRLRLHGRAVDRVRVPAVGARRGTEVAVEIFGEWVPAGVADEPLSTPRASGSGHERSSRTPSSASGRVGVRVEVARWRDHEPQSQGRGRRRALRAPCRWEGHRPPRHRPRRRARGDPGGSRARASGPRSSRSSSRRAGS